MNKTAQKKNEEQTYKSSEVMAMLEQINDGIEVIGEQHKEVVIRLDRLETKVDNLERKVDNLETRMDSMENTMERMQDDVTEIKHKLSEKVDREEFNKLEKRTVKLEKLVFAKLGQ